MQLLNATETYNQLKTHKEQFGYCTLPREERLLLKQLEKALGLTQEHREFKNKMRRWTDVYIPYRAKKSESTYSKKTSSNLLDQQEKQIVC